MCIRDRHLVMRKRKHFCESSYGDIFVILGIGGRAIEPLSFTEIEDEMCIRDRAYLNLQCSHVCL